MNALSSAKTRRPNLVLLQYSSPGTQPALGLFQLSPTTHSARFSAGGRRARLASALAHEALSDFDAGGRSARFASALSCYGSG